MFSRVKDDQMARNNAYMGAFFGAGPQLLNEGAKKMASSPNRVVSTIGKVASIPTGFIAPSQQQVNTIFQGYNRPQTLTPEQRNQLQTNAMTQVGGIVRPLSPQRVGSILPRMSGEDQIDMTNLLDFTRTKMVNGKRVTPNSPQAVNIERNARYVAEGMGFNPDQRNADLVKTFEQILNASRKRLFRR